MLVATPIVRSFAQRRFGRLSKHRPSDVQRDQLLGLVREAAATRFGRDHGFAGITDVAGFQERVPLRRYDDFWTDYWQAPFPRLENCTWPGVVPYFARTSGTTTGRTKYIPCSRAMLRSNVRAAKDILFLHLLNRPRSKVLGGKALMLGGSTDLQTEAADVLSGDISGIQANELPWWAGRYVFPSGELALLTDWEEKIDRIARLSLTENIRAISGAPAWLLVFFDRLAELRPDAPHRLASYYPKLELLVHGGMDFKPYVRRFGELLQTSGAELREVYPASEGFLAIADRAEGDGLRLIIDHGLFYEFVPVAELNAEHPTRHWLATVETDIEYAIVLSTCAGAWGYVLGDTVRFVDLDPPRIVITGRTSYVLSAFGEHLIDAEIEEAVAVAANAIDAAIADYCVAPELPDAPGAKGRHHYVVEFAARQPDAVRVEEFVRSLDNHLGVLNADYLTHRAQDFGLLGPHVTAVPPGTFHAWMKKRGRLGGQNKVPRVINDANLFADLRAFLAGGR